MRARSKLAQSVTAAFAAALLVSALFVPAAAHSQTVTPAQAAAGRDAVVRQCGSCHEAELVLSARHTPAEWNDILARMIGQGADVPADDLARIRSYLHTQLAAQRSPAPRSAPPAGSSP